MEDADIILILTDHSEFKNFDHAAAAKAMRTPQLFDTRNMVRPQEGSGLEIINYGNIYLKK